MIPETSSEFTAKYTAAATGSKSTSCSRDSQREATW
jgi:hypothetical protein